MTGQQQQSDPEFEFEGPMGKFWGPEEVPVPSLVAAIDECFRELARRGYSEAQLIEMVHNLQRERIEKMIRSLQLESDRNV